MTAQVLLCGHWGEVSLSGSINSFMEGSPEEAGHESVDSMGSRPGARARVIALSALGKMEACEANPESGGLRGLMPFSLPRWT